MNIENSSTTQLCSITLEESDLKKLEQLDPNQVQGLQTSARVSVPVQIIYTNEQSQQISDIQILQIQFLTRISQQSIPGNRRAPRKQILEHLQIYLSSQTDLYFNFVSNIKEQTFESIREANQLNIKFNQLPSVLVNMLKNVSPNHMQSGSNEAVLKLSYEGTGKLVIYQNTQYKKLQLFEMSFNRSTIQKAHQSIIYRFNYQKSKLRMLQNSIDSIYEILASKNPPLLQLIQSKVGIDE